MRIVIQRVSRAKVIIGKQTFSEIEDGLLVFVGVFREDVVEHADWLAKKTLNLRIFSDRNNRMNRSILDCRYGLLVVSQFTLAADCDRGNRPSFALAADPEKAGIIYENYVQALTTSGLTVRTGDFGSDMEVEMVNDGPATFVLDRV